MCVVAYLRSLPLWERGFKRTVAYFLCFDDLCRSPCGSVDLNDVETYNIPQHVLSLPLWERGFKQIHVLRGHRHTCRSPCGSVDLNEKVRLSMKKLPSSLPLWECKEK